MTIQPTVTPYRHVDIFDTPVSMCRTGLEHQYQHVESAILDEIANGLTAHQILNVISKAAQLAGIALCCKVGNMAAS